MNREYKAMLLSRAESCWDWHLKHLFHDSIPTLRSYMPDVLLFLSLLFYEPVNCLIMNN